MRVFAPLWPWCMRNAHHEMRGMYVRGARGVAGGDLRRDVVWGDDVLTETY
jgi:hypothetical protein